MSKVDTREVEFSAFTYVSNFHMSIPVFRKEILSQSLSTLPALQPFLLHLSRSRHPHVFVLPFGCRRDMEWVPTSFLSLNEVPDNHAERMAIHDP